MGDAPDPRISRAGWVHRVAAERDERRAHRSPRRMGQDTWLHRKHHRAVVARTRPCGAYVSAGRFCVHDLRVGEVHGRVTERVKDVAAMLRTVDSVEVTTDLWGE